METFRYHFVFQRKLENEDIYLPVLGKVFYEEDKIVSWEPIIFRENFEPLLVSYEEILKKTSLMQQAKNNLPVKMNDDQSLSFFHPNEDISFNDDNETVFNYSHEIEKSSLINIDLDQETLSKLKKLGADTSTVEGVQKFYELLGQAFIELLENSDNISDSEKESLKKSLKINKI